MARVGKSDVHAAMQRVGNMLKEAGGDESPVRISRADKEELIQNLKGTEKELADTFFRFVDHRDARPGATVTAKDIDKGLEYAKAHLVDNYDLNNNGLSQSEIQQMSKIGKLAVQLAKELKTAEQTPHGLGDLKPLVAQAFNSDIASKAYLTGADSIEWSGAQVEHNGRQYIVTPEPYGRPHPDGEGEGIMYALDVISRDVYSFPTADWVDKQIANGEAWPMDEYRPDMPSDDKVMFMKLADGKEYKILQEPGFDMYAVENTPNNPKVYYLPRM